MKAYSIRARSLAEAGRSAMRPRLEGLRDLDECTVVEQGQRLEWRIGPEPPRTGLGPAASIERGERTRTELCVRNRSIDSLPAIPVRVPGRSATAAATWPEGASLPA